MTGALIGSDHLLNCSGRKVKEAHDDSEQTEMNDISGHGLGMSCL